MENLMTIKLKSKENQSTVFVAIAKLSKVTLQKLLY
jgi:hypothetical protein